MPAIIWVSKYKVWGEIKVQNASGCAKCLMFGCFFEGHMVSKGENNYTEQGLI